MIRLGILALLVGGAAFGAAVCVGDRFDSDPGPALQETPFVAEDWKNASPASDRRRLEMVGALLESGTLVGRRLADVEILLGPIKPSPFDADNQVAYDLGREVSSFAVDHSWLVLRLESGLVRDGYVTTD